MRRATVNAGKKVNGRKRHFLMDTLVLLLAVNVTTASVQDCNATPKLAAPLSSASPASSCGFILWFLVIIVALTAIGLSANIRKMISSGARPILLGLDVWIAVLVSSLLVQWMIGQL